MAKWLCCKDLVLLFLFAFAGFAHGYGHSLLLWLAGTHFCADVAADGFLGSAFFQWHGNHSITLKQPSVSHTA